VLQIVIDNDYQHEVSGNESFVKQKEKGLSQN